MQCRYQHDLHPSEILLSNVIDSEFQDLFKPLYFISIIFCLRKFDLYDNFITPNTKKDFISCVLGMIIVYLLLFSTLKYFAMVFDTSMVFTIYFITYFQYAINYTILCFMNVFEGKLNVDVLLHLNRINKCLPSISDDRKAKWLTWISLCMLIIAYIFLILFKLLLDPFWSWCRAIFVATTLIFDLELLYIIFITNFLACKTNTWRRVLKTYQMKSEDSLCYENEEVQLNKMLLTFETIIKALELAKKASKWTILFHFVIAFSQALSYFEILILWMNIKSSDIVATKSHMFGVILWVVKSLIAEATLCVICEILYQRIAGAQVDVILYFGHRPSGVARRFRKNFFRLSNTRLEKFSPLGVFSVDAALPLRMGALLANYIIVMIQFAFS